MKTGGLVAMALMLSPATGWSETFCAGIERLSAAAETGFSQDPAPLESAESCLVATTTMGRASYHCNWPFPFRDPAARATYEDFGASIRTCFAAAEETPVDEGVNHPDSYEQRAFVLGPARLRLSLKDKSQLGLTYVFLTIEAVGQ